MRDPANNLSCKLESVDGAQQPYRLALVISHPVQYFSPLFRRLAEHPVIDLTVLYCSLRGAQSMRDPGFGVSFAWDVPLLEGYHYKELKNYGWKKSKGFFSCINPGVVTELKEGSYDAGIVFGWGALTAWLAYASARIAAVPWMIYGDSTALDENRRHRPTQALRRVLLRILFGSTDAFLVSGAFNRKFYELYGVPPEKCFDVPFAVDVSFFARRAEAARRRRNEIRARFGIPHDKVLFLFVGKLLKRKRPQDLLEATKVLRATTPNAAAVFVGDGELRPSLEAQISAAGIPGTHLLGFRNQSELPEIYAMADAFVLTSSCDPKPLVTNEAMACGLPVVASDRTGVWGPGDILRDGENGFVYPCGDVRALAEVLGRLAKDAGLRRRMGRRSFQIVQDFTCEKCVDGILKALNSAVVSRRSRPHCNRFRKVLDNGGLRA